MPSPNILTLAHRATPSDDALFQEVGGEAVLLDLASEFYFGLNPVGARIWTLLGENNLLQSVNDILCVEYDAEPERITADLLALVTRLSETGLVKIS